MRIGCLRLFAAGGHDECVAAGGTRLMIDKVFANAEAAIADIPDNVTILFGGFASAGSPTTLILALQKKGVRGITGVANNIGLGDRLDVLCEQHQIKKMIATFAIRASGARRSLFEEQYRRGEVELEVAPPAPASAAFTRARALARR